MLTREIRIEVDSLPAKARPRFNRGQAYTDGKTKADEDLIAYKWRSNYGMDMSDYAGPVNLTIYAYRPGTRSYQEGSADMAKPDIDNMAKLVMDALNGVAYKDDAQVVTLHVAKSRRSAYCDAPWLHIAVRYEEA